METGLAISQLLVSPYALPVGTQDSSANSCPAAIRRFAADVVRPMPVASCPWLLWVRTGGVGQARIRFLQTASSGVSGAGLVNPACRPIRLIRDGPLGLLRGRSPRGTASRLTSDHVNVTKKRFRNRRSAEPGSRAAMSTLVGARIRPTSKYRAVSASS